MSLSEWSVQFSISYHSTCPIWKPHWEGASLSTIRCVAQCEQSSHLIKIGRWLEEIIFWMIQFKAFKSVQLIQLFRNYVYQLSDHGDHCTSPFQSFELRNSKLLHAKNLRRRRPIAWLWKFEFRYWTCSNSFEVCDLLRLPQVAPKEEQKEGAVLMKKPIWGHFV